MAATLGLKLPPCRRSSSEQTFDIGLLDAGHWTPKAGSKSPYVQLKVYFESDLAISEMDTALSSRSYVLEYGQALPQLWAYLQLVLQLGLLLLCWHTRDS